MNKATTVIASVPLRYIEDDFLNDLSKRLRMPKAGVLRLGLHTLLKQYNPTAADKMLRQRICASIAILLLSAIELNSWLSFADDEFRGTRKSCARKVRRGREDVWQFEVEGA